MTALITKNADSKYGIQARQYGIEQSPSSIQNSASRNLYPGSGIRHPASSIQLKTTSEDHHLARMAALAIGLTMFEAAIPSPLPGVKPGLANIITLIVLARYGWRAAAWVSLLRVVAGSLLLGSFLTPGFFLSLSGALCSLLVLAVSQHLPSRWFGTVTHSVLAAFAHIAGQLLLVYFWLIPHTGLIYLVPIFATAALVFGTVNGLIAAHFLNAPELPLNTDLYPPERAQ